MQELAREIVQQVDTFDATDLDAAACKWGEHALRTFTGPLLQKALAISVAIVEFTAELLPKDQR